MKSNPLTYLRRPRARLALSVAALAVTTVGIAVVQGTSNASTLALTLSVLQDGSAPFEDWAPGDTLASGPTGDSIHQAGDDLSANNGIVRTGDTVFERLNYSVNPPFPSGYLELTLTARNGAVFPSDWALGSGSCPSGSSFNAARTTFTCGLGVMTSASGTTAWDVPLFVPLSVANGTSVGIDAVLTEQGGTPVSATGPATVVSAAPRYEVVKRPDDDQIVGAPGPDTASNVEGVNIGWIIGVRAADPDPRGLSALTNPVSISDLMGNTTGFRLQGCNFGGVPGYPMGYDDFAGTERVTASTVACSQPSAGGPITLDFQVNWDRLIPLPTVDAWSNPLVAEGTGWVAATGLTTWVPMSEIDMADGTANGAGSLIVANGAALTSGGSTASGTCSTGAVWSPGSTTTAFDPVDSQGVNNLGAGVEPIANNGGCRVLEMNIQGGSSKSSSTSHGAGVIPGQNFSSWVSFYSNGTSSIPAGAQICDKLDNSRFVLVQEPTLRETTEPGWWNGDFHVEYGAGAWGTYFPGGAGTDDASAFFDQSTTPCSDAEALELVGTTKWFSGTDVDFTNSGANTIDADQINMIRVTLDDPVSPGTSNLLDFVWEALPNPSGTQLRNYAASRLYSPTWNVADCPGQDWTAQTCEVPLSSNISAGNPAAWWRIVNGAATVEKNWMNSPVYNAGDTVRWRVTANSVPSFVPDTLGDPFTGTGSSDVVLRDVLPSTLTYVPGSALSWNAAFNSSTPFPDPVITPDSPTVGYSTLEWDLGTMPWNTSQRISFDTVISLFTPSGSVTNYAEVHTQYELEQGALPSFPTLDPYQRRVASQVSVTGLSQAIISKSATTPAIVAGDDAVYSLLIGNPSSDDVETMDAIDILPWNGDPRGSVIEAGTFALKDVTTSYPNTEFWVTTVAPATLDGFDGNADSYIDPRDGDITAVGSAQWPCTVADTVAGTAGCPALADVTAVRIVGSDPNTGSSGTGSSYLPAGSGPYYFDMTFSTTTTAQIGDTYRNSWLAAFEGLDLPVLFEAEVVPSITPVGVGDFVFTDMDGDGKYTAGDEGIGQVAIELYRVGDTPGVDAPAGTATTDGDGRWFIGDLAPGDYVVFLPDSNFVAGAPLYGRTQATAAVADPNTNVDEAGDHNTIAGSGIVTGTVSLDLGTEPTGDGTTPAGYRDADVNNTVDLAFNPFAEIDIQTTVYSGTSSGAGCPGSELIVVATGTDVTWCFVVTNTGTTNLDISNVTATALGITDADMTLLSGTPDVVAPGASVVYYYEAPAADLTVTAAVTANPETADGSDIVSLADVTDNDPAEVQVVSPAITLAKTVYSGYDSAASCPGTETVFGPDPVEVTWCFTVTNSGDTYLADIQLDDTTLGVDQTGLTLVSGTPSLMAPGDVVVWAYEGSVSVDTTNTASVSGNPVDSTGTDLAGLTDPTDDDDASVDVVAPAIDVQKTIYEGDDSGASCPGSETIAVASGTAVTWCFVVTNTGDTSLSNVALDDQALGITSADMSGPIADLALMAPDASVTLYYVSNPFVALDNTVSAVGNPATSTGGDIPGLTDPTDSDTASVTLLSPSITVAKTVYFGHDAGAGCATAVENVVVPPGADVTWCFTATNDGGTWLSPVTIDDPALSITDADMTVASGDPASVAPGGAVSWYFEGTAAADVDNTAYATGNPTTEDGTDIATLSDVLDDDPASVDVLAASITIAKTVYTGVDSGAGCVGTESVYVAAGSDVTWCFVVTNTGDTHLSNVTVDDPTLAITNADMTVITGDPALLAPGASVSWYYEGPAPADISNTASTEGTPADSQGETLVNFDPVTDDDPAAVDVVAPAIAVQKTVYEGADSGAGCPGAETVTVGSGTDVTWCFQVTNTGDTYLSNVTLDDPLIGITGADMTVLSGDLALMAPGASATLYFVGAANGDINNTVTATGNPSSSNGDDLPGVTNPTDDDTAAVDVVGAGIAIAKTVYVGHDSGASCGGSELVTVPNPTDVTWCFTVTNMGDTHLADVGVDDSVLGITDADMTLVSGDPTLLAPTESISWYFEGSATADIANTAVTTGNPVLADGTDIASLADVTDDDPASVDVVAPAVEVVKTVYLGHDSGAGCPGGELATGASGFDVTWCFTVTNTGDTYLSDVSLDDADLGVTDADMTLLSGTPSLMAPGATAVFFYEGTGVSDLTNTVTVTGTPSDPTGVPFSEVPPVTDTDDASIDVRTATIDIQTTVYAGTDAGASCAGSELVHTVVGDAVTWCFIVTNTGDTHLADVTLGAMPLGITAADAVLLSGDPALLAPGASIVWYFEGTSTGDVTVDTDTSGNPSFADGTDIPGMVDPTDTDPASIDVVAPGISIAKTAIAGSAGTCPGGEVATVIADGDVMWCFVVTNTGDVYLDDVSVDDPTLSITQADMTLVSGDPAHVAPGETVVWSYVGPVAADVDNTATATGTPAEPDGTPLTGIDAPTDDDPASVDVVAPAVEVVKTVYLGHDSGAGCPGGELATGASGFDVTWCFTVTNTGDTYLSDVSLDDADLGVTDADMTLLSGTPSLMAPGATAVFFYEGTGVSDLTNTVTVTGTPSDPTGVPFSEVPPVTDTDDASIDVVAPGVSLAKTVTTTSSCPGVDHVITVADAALTWCFAATNTGDTHLSGLAIDDADLGIATADLELVSGDPALVAPGDTVIWRYVGAATADLTNVATVTGNPVTPTGEDLVGVPDVTDDDDASVDVVAPSIEVLKTVAAGHGGAAACPAVELIHILVGEPDVTWCFVATNTGDTYLADVALTDDDLGISTADMTVIAGDPSLVAPGGSVTWFYEGAATTDIHNVVDAVANPSDSDGNDITTLSDVSDSDPADVDVIAPAIEVAKSVYAGHDGGAMCPGSEHVTTAVDYDLTWCFTVTNTGDAALSGLTFGDAALGIDLADLTLISGDASLLAPGSSVVYFYESTNPDGGIENTATVSGLPSGPDGEPYVGTDPVTDDDDASTSTGTTAISVVKTVYFGHDSAAACPGSESILVGDNSPVTWCFAITNTGSTTLVDVTLSDPTLGIDQADVTVISGDLASVEPGATVVVAYESEASNDIANTVEVSGTPVDENGDPMPGVDPPTSTDDANVDVVNPEISISKTVYAGHDAGQSCEGSDTVSVTTGFDVTWCFMVTNTGDSHVANVGFVDDLLAITDADATMVSGNATAAGSPALLAPGESVIWFFEGQVTQAINNVVTTTGTPVDPDGEPIPGTEDVGDDDDATVEVGTPGIAIEKTALTPVVAPNSEATFEITVTNTGDVELRDVVVIDEIAADCNRTIGVLAVDAQETFTCTMTVGDTDVVNVAVATGETDNCAVGASSTGEVCVEDSDDAEVTIGAAVLEFEKVALTKGPIDLGDEVTFEFRLKNAGDLEMTDVVVDDARFPACNRDVGTVAPGEELKWTCTVASPESGDSVTNAASVSAVVLGSELTMSDADTVAMIPGELSLVDQVTKMAKTGASVGGLLTMAAGLTVLGGALILFRRRRSGERVTDV